MTLLAIGAGLLIGASLGALGGGGSILTVPVLVYLLGQSPHAATAASLLVVGIAAAAGAVTHARAGRVRFRTGVMFGVLGVAGSYAGSRASAAVPAGVLLAGFGVLMLAVAATMIARSGALGSIALSLRGSIALSLRGAWTRRLPLSLLAGARRSWVQAAARPFGPAPPSSLVSRSSVRALSSSPLGSGVPDEAVMSMAGAQAGRPAGPPEHVTPAGHALPSGGTPSRAQARPAPSSAGTASHARAGPAGNRHPALVAAAATGVGFITGFFGVGGGFVVVPVLVLLLGLDMAAAAGTSLVVITIDSAAALAARAWHGGMALDWPVVAAFTAAAVAGAAVGGRWAGRLSPRRLTTSFTVLIIVVACYTLARSTAGLLLWAPLSRIPHGV